MGCSQSVFQSENVTVQGEKYWVAMLGTKPVEISIPSVSEVHRWYPQQYTSEHSRVLSAQMVKFSVRSTHR